MTPNRSFLKWRGLRLFGGVCVLLIGIASATYAAQQSLAPPSEPPLWIWIRANTFAIVIFVFHCGVSWREFLDHRRRLSKLETETPETYVRADVLAEQFKRLEERITLALEIREAPRGHVRAKN